MKRLVALYISWLITGAMLVLAIVQPAQIRRFRVRGHRFHGAGHNIFAADFYTLLRWITCVTFAYSAVTAYRMKKVAWVWVFGILAVLFNPLAPVYLQRTTWQMIDWAAIAVIVLAGVIFQRSSLKS
jgi:hypothetical protein